MNKCPRDCYECCSSVPFTQEERQAVLDSGQPEWKFRQNNKGDWYSSVKVMKVSDGVIISPCAFKTPESCEIYDLRPQICRQFVCERLLGDS